MLKRIALLGILVIVVAACGTSTIGGGPPRTAPPPAPTDDPLCVDPTEGPDPTTAFVLPKNFETLNKRGWAKVVKSPDTYIGRGFKLFACIWQFDAATGDDGFLGNASFHKVQYWNLDGENAAFTGDAGKLAPFVEGDIVSMNVAMLGSYSYDTQAGGNTTVPSFQVVKIKQEKGDCS